MTEFQIATMVAIGWLIAFVFASHLALHFYTKWKASQREIDGIRRWHDERYESVKEQRNLWEARYAGLVEQIHALEIEGDE